MADNPLLPGTDIEVVEKYAPGKRLDFPDFASVCKTSFAKGVITDFKRPDVANPEDPIVVAPMVKVKVDGLESDWLPLFYHPKEKMWDGPAGPSYNHVSWSVPSYDATDYDEETGSFRKAWMSFRCGDKVAVILQEKNPVAVLGFADAVPRVGEDIIKFVTNDPFIWQMSQSKEHGSEIGPDGLSLKLELEAERITTQENSEDTVLGSVVTLFSQNCNLNIEIEEFSNIGPLAQEVGITKHFTRDINWSSTIQKVKCKRKFEIHLMKVGPILYLITSLFNGPPVEEYENYSEVFSDTLWHRQCTIDDMNIWPYGMGLPPLLPFHRDWCAGPEGYVEAQVAAEMAACGGSWPDDPLDLSDYEETTVSLRIYAGLYTDKLYEDIKSNPPTYNFSTRKLDPEPPNGFTYQTELNHTIGHLYGEHKRITAGGMKYYSRPHTKEELIAYGMWPGAEE